MVMAGASTSAGAGACDSQVVAAVGWQLLMVVVVPTMLEPE